MVFVSSEDRFVIIRSQQDNADWWIKVEDCGIGIPEAEVPYVFEQFYRASTAKDTEVQGARLGLHVSKAIVEAHGGLIGIDSTLGRGTRSWFSLPRS